MTNPSSPDEDRELIEDARNAARQVATGDKMARLIAADTLYVCSHRLESLLADRAKLEGDWFDKAIRDHADEHGPSGGAWNISMVLERLHRAKPALNRSTDRAT